MQQHGVTLDCALCVTRDQTKHIMDGKCERFMERFKDLILSRGFIAHFRSLDGCGLVKARKPFSK